MRRYFLIAILLISFSGTAQTEDTVFSYSNFIELVSQHHPIAYQAQLQTNKAEAIKLKGKGGFDPKINGIASQKYFEGKQYYSYLNSHLKIPLWYGLEVTGGVTRNDGERLNPESYTPLEGQTGLGLTANLGKGLFIDERRSELKQSRIYANSTLIEQRLMINQLLTDASMAYWDWFKAYNKVIIYEEALSNATERLIGIRASTEFGDKPLVDTLKAKIQVQEREIKLAESKLEFENKKKMLEVFLWQDGLIPLEMDSGLYPANYQNTVVSLPVLKDQNDIDTLVANHPEMLMSLNKIEISKIKFRLKKEYLKPELQLKYNALNTAAFPNITNEYTVENYAWGAKVSYPLFTRKERAEVRLAEIELMEQEMEMQNKSAQINYKINAALNTLNTSNILVNNTTDMVNNYRTLFESESTLFVLGESSLFLVNIRDKDMIDGQLKLLEQLYRNKIAEINYKYQTFGF